MGADMRRVEQAVLLPGRSRSVGGRQQVQHLEVGSFRRFPTTASPRTEQGRLGWGRGCGVAQVSGTGGQRIRVP
jgi:hypothetical protein